MPKYNYNPTKWAYRKNCAYCGKVFYPQEGEDFCSFNCKFLYKEYTRQCNEWNLEWLHKHFQKEDI